MLIDKILSGWPLCEMYLLWSLIVLLILLKTADMNNPVVVLVKKSRSFVKAKIYRLYVA